MRAILAFGYYLGNTGLVLNLTRSSTGVIRVLVSNLVFLLAQIKVCSSGLGFSLEVSVKSLGMILRKISTSLGSN